MERGLKPATTYCDNVSAKGSGKNNLAESAAMNPTGDLTNAHFPMLNSHPKWMAHRLQLKTARKHAAASPFG